MHCDRLGVRFFEKQCWSIVCVSLEVSKMGENFLHSDSGAGDDKRMIVYATEGNIELLKECQEWFLDGTFRVQSSLSNLKLI